MNVEGIVLKIDKIESKRIDLILIQENKSKPCRVQVRKEMFSQLDKIKPEDKVSVSFNLELNEIYRGGIIHRFDNAIAQKIEKI